MLPNLSVLSIDAGEKRSAESDDAPSPPPKRLSTTQQQQPRGFRFTHTDLLKDLPPDLFYHLLRLVIAKSMDESEHPCRVVKKWCVDKDTCEDDNFWKSVCDHFEWTRPDVTTTTDPPLDSWKKIFGWWCDHKVLTNAGIRRAVRECQENGDWTHPTYGPISKWYTRFVTDMSRLFANTGRFNQPLEWDTRNVESMSSMFEMASFFNQPLKWNTKKVKYMSHMFYGATFNQPLEWDTGKVENMSFMFFKARDFNQTLEWNTKNVKRMERMFYGASSFNNGSTDGVADKPLKWKTGNVKIMSGLFAHAISFNQPLKWDTGEVEDMDQMFLGATEFNQTLEWNTGKVERTSDMFWGASSFNNGSTDGVADKPLEWNTEKVQDMDQMFHGATSFNQPLDKWNTEKVEDMSYMFWGATSFRNGAPSHKPKRPLTWAEDDTAYKVMLLDSDHESE